MQSFPPGNVLDAFCSELELEGGPKKVAFLGEKTSQTLVERK